MIYVMNVIYILYTHYMFIGVYVYLYMHICILYDIYHIPYCVYILNFCFYFYNISDVPTEVITTLFYWETYRRHRTESSTDVHYYIDKCLGSRNEKDGLLVHIIYYVNIT